MHISLHYAKTVFKLGVSPTRQYILSALPCSDDTANGCPYWPSMCRLQEQPISCRNSAYYTGKCKQKTGHTHTQHRPPVNRHSCGELNGYLERNVRTTQIEPGTYRACRPAILTLDQSVPVVSSILCSLSPREWTGIEGDGRNNLTARDGVRHLQWMQLPGRRSWTSKWTQMDANGRKWTQVDANGPKWSLTDANGRKWTQIDPNGH